MATVVNLAISTSIKKNERKLFSHPFSLERLNVMGPMDHGEQKRMAVAAGKESSDVPLTIAGREEIAIIARSVKDLNLKFSAIVTSPLKRAVQTAQSGSFPRTIGHEPVGEIVGQNAGTQVVLTCADVCISNVSNITLSACIRRTLLNQ